MHTRIVCFFYFIFFSSSLFAEEIQTEVQVNVSSGSEISVTLFKVETPKAVLLWIPTEYGIRGRETSTALALNKKGIEVWLADLHSSYFIPKGRRSYNEIKAADISNLIIKASNNKKREVTLFATGRAAPLVLKATRKLQLKKETRSIVKSAIFFHPNFYAGSAEAGKNIEYVPITYASNLAIYIVQPALSGKRYQLNTLEKHLKSGGSDIIKQILPNTGDGFNVRQPDNKTEIKFYKKTPSIISNAIKLLKSYDKPRVASTLTDADLNTKVSSLKTGLQLYKGNITNLYLDFIDLNNKRHTLKDHKGEVLLINFWATWCPPCVKELPSLNRLQKKINNKNFNILAVNIGEETNTVKKFLSKMDIKFPVLSDPLAESVEPWKLIAFPSSFVIDKHGTIRYGLFGGLEWDNKEVQQIIQKLLKEQ